MRTVQDEKFKILVNGQRSISPIRRQESKEVDEKKQQQTKGKVNFI